MRTILFLSVLSLCVSCKKAWLLEPAGEQTTETRQWQAYDEIILYDKVNLQLKYDSVESVSVRAGKNLIPGIVTSVVNGQLTIRDENSFKWSRDLDETVTVIITGNKLSKIAYYGSGIVESVNQWRGQSFAVDSWEGVGSFRLNVNTDHLTLIVRKANADMAVTGRARLITGYIADHGSIDLTNCMADTMMMDFRSIRKSTIRVKDKLDINIHYKGDVYYFGDPVIKLFRYGTGALIKAG